MTAARFTTRPKPTPGCRHCQRQHPFPCYECASTQAGMPEPSTPADKPKRANA